MNKQILGAHFEPTWHRPFLRYFDGEQGGAGGDGQGGGEQEAKTFTQDEVNTLIKDRLAQQAKNKFGDYDELKAKAGTAQTLEDRVGSLESELTSTRSEAARTRVAAQFGISTTKGANGEPSDAEILLTGSDEAAMTAQAQRLTARAGDQKKNGLRARKEGQTVTTTISPKDKAKRDWLASLRGDDA